MAEKTGDTIIDTALERYEYANSELSDNRERARADLDFGRLGRQWPEDIRKLRDSESRPMLTINRIPAFIRQVVNDARLNKPSIKVRPVDNKADPETAKVLQGLIRNIESTSNADIAYDTAIDYAASAGIGFIRVDLDYARNDTFDMDIQINGVENVLSVLFDPDTTEYDSRDWDFAFISDVFNESAYERKYPKAEKIDFSNWSSAEGWQSTEDGIRVAEYWERTEHERNLLLLTDGTVVWEDAVTDEMKATMMAKGIRPTRERMAKSYKITQRVINGVEVLEENEWGGSIIPVVPVYGELVNLNGERVWRSMFHDAKDSQRMLNYWRTASTELVALAPKAPFVGPEAAFDGYEEMWQNANTQSYAYLPYKGQIAPSRQTFSTNAAAEIQEATLASNDMKDIMGIHDAGLGIPSNETSGIAINNRQREGDISNFHLIDNLSRSIQCVGEIIVEMIPSVYTEERIVRVLGEDSKPRMVTINERVPDEESGYDKVLRNLTTGKYDVTVEAGPSFTTRRQEAVQSMERIVTAMPDAAPILGDLIARASDWPEADKVAERLRYLLPEEIRQAEAIKDGVDDMSIEEVVERAEVEIMKREQRIKELEQQAETVMMVSQELKDKKVEVDNAIKDLKRQEQHLTDTRQTASAELRADQAQFERNVTEKFTKLENKLENLVETIAKDAGILEDVAVMESMRMIQAEMEGLQGTVMAMGQSQSQALDRFIEVLSQPVQVQRDEAGRVTGAQRQVPPIPM